MPFLSVVGGGGDAIATPSLDVGLGLSLGTVFPFCPFVSRGPVLGREWVGRLEVVLKFFLGRVMVPSRLSLRK